MDAKDTTIEGQLAADGSHFPGACNSLGEFVQSIEDGQFSADVQAKLKELNAELCDHALHNGGIAKGKLTLTFDFKQEGGLTEIRSGFKVVLPEDKRSKSIMWSTEDNRFTRNRPGQREMFGIRDASAPGRAVRDA